MKKKVVIGLVIVIALAAIIRLVFFRGEFLYAGTIEATKVDVSARISSVIAEEKFDEGQKIGAGETLLTFTCEDIKLAADLAKKNFERTARLFRTGSLPQDAFDQVQNKKQDADLRLEWCTVKSPVTGTVLNRYHEPGELIPQGTRLFTLANLKDVWANVYVPQPLLAKLTLGQKVRAFLPEANMREFEGVITHISDQAEFTPKNVQTREERTRLVFGIKVNFNNPDEVLKPGMSIEVKLPEQ